MIRAGLDRDNFTDLHRLWDPIAGFIRNFSDIFP